MHQVLVEESVIGWKEIEIEVMKDAAGAFIVICSIENLDVMGIHTGESITVAPALTCTDKEYQAIRDMSRRIINRIGLTAGGANLQFAVDPQTGRTLVIEVNPRVSRSSALASKATGFPIAKVSTTLAVGYPHDELLNDITKVTPALFEPTIDYVVAKIPRWNMEKFPQADDTLGTQMKSVGEVMAIGRTFGEALLKGVSSLEDGRDGIFCPNLAHAPLDEIRHNLRVPTPRRLYYLPAALDAGLTIDEINELSHIDPWFLREIAALCALRDSIAGRPLEALDAEELRAIKRAGFSDALIARLLSPAVDELDVRARRKALGVLPGYSRVDTCGGEFAAQVDYLYSTYEGGQEVAPSDGEKIIVLGSGPNRIGQGIEFDYCCTQASFAFQAMGYETIMVNCNPETVSTDYDVSDRLYFEPLTLEHIPNIVDLEQPAGVIVQFGGQTPLKLARRLAQQGVPILGTSPDAIDLAEDRERFGDFMRELGLPMPEHGIAHNEEEALPSPSGSATRSSCAPPTCSAGGPWPSSMTAPPWPSIRSAVLVAEDTPILIDRFLEDAFEMDVDCVSDGVDVRIAAIMEQIELTGVHSGDSGLRHPHRDGHRGGAGDAARLHPAAGPRPADGRLPERAVRHEGRGRLRDRGQPARLADGALRQQGHRRGLGHGGLPDCVGRRLADLNGSTSHACRPLCQGSGAAVYQVPR